MKPFEKCPVCGGEVVDKEVEKLLRGGSNTAMLTVNAEVCLHCGERFYSEETVKCFEDIRAKLECGQVGEFKKVGDAYQAAT